MLRLPAKLFTLIILVFIESIVALIWNLAIPGDRTSAVLFGLSLQRLLLAAVPFVLILLSLSGLAVRSINESAIFAWAAGVKNPRVTSSVVPLLSWLSLSCITLLLIGQSVLGLSAAIMQRLAPDLVLLFMLFAQIGIFILRDSGQRPASSRLLSWKSFFLFLTLLVMVVAACVAVGVQHALASLSYSGAGIPILPKQVMIALYAAGSFMMLDALLKKRPRAKTCLAIITAILLFLLAAVSWMSIPIPETHFTHASNLGDGEFILQSDSSTYDLNAHRMLAGLGLAAGQPLPRPLFSYFLGLAHLLFGTQVSAALNAHTILLALIPALIFLLGRKLAFPAAGVMAACLFIFREYNQAALSSVVILSSVRMLLSELFTALFLLCLIIAAVSWLKIPSSRTRAAISGALLGLTALIRTQVLILLPLLMLWGLLSLWRQRTQWLKASLWLILGVLLVVLPWMGRNAMRSGSFTFDDPAYAALWELDEEQASDVSVVAAALDDPLGLLRDTVSFFANNALSSLYQLPWAGSLGLDLEGYQSQNTVPPFYPAFNPQPGQVAAIIVHLILIAFGLAAAWHIGGWGGLLPAGVYLSYAVSSSLVGFSGWRFILPVDWIILLYWAVGVITATKMLTRSFVLLAEPVLKKEKDIPVREWQTGKILAVALLLGLVLPLGESIFPRRIDILDRAGIQQKISATAPSQDIQNLAADPSTRLIQGLLFYPVYMDSEQTFTRLKVTSSEVRSESPLLRFFVVLQDRTTVFLPVRGVPDPVPNAVPVVVVGCSWEKGLVASAVLVDIPDPYWLVSRKPVPTACAE